MNFYWLLGLMFGFAVDMCCDRTVPWMNKWKMISPFALVFSPYAALCIAKLDSADWFMSLSQFALGVMAMVSGFLLKSAGIFDKSWSHPRWAIVGGVLLLVSIVGIACLTK